MQLAQSPYLNILSDEKVNATLHLMGRAPGDHLTKEVAREICQRTSSTAMLSRDDRAGGRAATRWY